MKDEHIFSLMTPVKSFEVDLPSNALTYESRCFTLDDIEVLAVSFWINSPQEGGFTSFFIRNTGAEQFDRQSVLQFYTEHVRNLIKVNTKWGPAIMIADHGLDVLPFEGGKLRLIVYENRNLVDKSGELPQEREFYFDLCSFVESGEKYDSVIVTALDNGRTRPKYLKFSDNGVLNLSAELPEEWLLRQKHFMSICEIPQKDNSQNYIALGKVDFVPARGIKNDVIKKTAGGKWSFTSDFAFDEMKKNPEWGTVKIRVGKVSESDNNPYMICLNHDFGFKNADIQMYIINSDHLEPVKINNTHPQFQSGPFYLHDAVFCDLDQDGECEILVSCREHRNWNFEKWSTDMFVLKRLPDGIWKVLSLSIAEKRINRVESISLLSLKPLNLIIKTYGKEYYKLLSK